MSGTNLIVFRDDSQQVSAVELRRQLCADVVLADLRDPASALNALLLCGEVECALADREAPGVQRAVLLTDAVASALLGRDEVQHVPSLARQIADQLPSTLEIRHPEGFSYYGLHPLDFSHAAEALKQQRSVAVIGLRSIGTTLSAVVQAALVRKGVRAERTTVRPEGHPYNRRARFSEEQILWIAKRSEEQSEFLIVDEGPGLSGSSFLSVGEGLIELGVSRERITLLGTRQPDPAQLCSDNAAERWRHFRFVRVNSSLNEQYKLLDPISGGEWRSVWLGDEDTWPACWQQMESLKFLSKGRRSVFKFDGLGSAGEATRSRAQRINEAGFGPRVEEAGSGMMRYEVIRGQASQADRVSTAILERIAEYCAFRASEFVTTHHSDDQLQTMVRHNVQQETGCEIEFPAGVLVAEKPVITDSRMQRQEWIWSGGGSLLKVDVGRHGDDHFMPGPTDIAWDLAGAIIEWDLHPNASSYLLDRFEQRTGVKRDALLPYYLIAYSAFRSSYCAMACNSSDDISEKTRLSKARAYYRNKLEYLLHPGAAATF